MSKELIVSIIIILIGISGVYFLTAGRDLQPRNAGNGVTEEPVYCTMDAFECPDGTWIGRTGPNCEFDCSTNQ
jgi:hypothetical protein